MSSQNPYENYPPSVPPTQYSQPGTYDSAQFYGQPQSGYAANPYGQAQVSYGVTPYGQPQSGYAANPYTQQQFAYAYAPVQAGEPGKGQAITGMVLGIIALCVFCSPILSALVAVPGLIFSILGRRSITGRGMATAGLVLSTIALIIAVGIFAIFGAFLIGTH